MLRLSAYMKLLARPERTTRPARSVAPRGPVVIWNLTRRCNLLCEHCYAFAADYNFPGELSTQQAMEVLDDLAAMNIRALILSGGEPLMRPDIMDIAARAKELGLYVAMSTNGTIMTPELVAAMARLDIDYVGISLDGLEAIHDRFRRQEGAFRISVDSLRKCRDAGLKVGIRFTLTRETVGDLPALLDLMEKEKIHKFYLSHLNYAGRGGTNKGSDALHTMTRDAMDLFFERAFKDASSGGDRDYVTGNNDADAVYLLQWAEKHFPHHIEKLKTVLLRWGGNSTGVGIANIDSTGAVHPDTMWSSLSLGNVKRQPFSKIWTQTDNPIMLGLRQHPRPVKGRCAECCYLAICNGNTRTRALHTTRDVWAEDPGCYLTDNEIFANKMEIADA